MLSKYGRQLYAIEGDIQFGISQGHSKSSLLSKLRRKKLLLHYMDQCRKRIDAIAQKQFAVEQLEITAMQIESMRITSGVFKRFTTGHNIDKLEELQSTVEDLHDQIMDINEALDTPMLDMGDADFEQELIALGNTAVEVPISTFPSIVNEEVSVSDRYHDVRDVSQVPLLV